MDACICMAEPHCYSPETTTALLMGYTHLKFGEKKKEKNLLSKSYCSSTEPQLNTVKNDI